MSNWFTRSLVCGAVALFTASGCNASLGDSSFGSGPDGSTVADSASAVDSASCPVADPDGQLTAFQIDGAISINGALDDSTWQNSRFVEFSNPQRSDNEVRVQMAWSTDDLYFAFQVVDSLLETDPGVVIHQNDGTEFYLDTGHDETEQLDGNDYHYIVSTGGDVQGGSIQASIVAMNGSYIMEMAIPWTAIGGQPQPDQVMGLLLGNNDRDNGASVQFDWRNLIESGSYARPNLWGDLYLTAITADGTCQ